MADWMTLYRAGWANLVHHARDLVGDADAQDLVNEAAIIGIQRQMEGKAFSWRWGLRGAARTLLSRRERPSITGEIPVACTADLCAILQASLVTRTIGQVEARRIVDGQQTRALRVSRRLLEQGANKDAASSVAFCGHTTA